MTLTFAILKVMCIKGDLRFSIFNSKEFQLTFKTTLCSLETMLSKNS